MSTYSTSDTSQATTSISDGSRPELRLRIAFFALDLAERPVLRVALLDQAATVRLPSGSAYPTEPLDDAARRIAREETGVTGQYLEQLYTFSHFAGDCWFVVVSSIALASHAMAVSSDHPRVRWSDVRSIALSDPVDRQVLNYALVRLRAKLGYTTIAFHLMPPTFTLSELQRAYETILDQPLDKRNFRRRMIASGILDATAGVRRAGSHRPAALYRFRDAEDRSTYLTPR